jgi:hypothetical protein
MSRSDYGMNKCLSFKFLVLFAKRLLRRKVELATQLKTQNNVYRLVLVASTNWDVISAMVH